MEWRQSSAITHSHVVASHPPQRITDAAGRVIDLRVSGDGPLDDEREALVEMYLDFDPTHRSLGLPPVGERRIREWLDILLDGLDVLAWHGQRVVGQASLVESSPQECEMVIFLHQEYHGSGIGTRLTETALSYGQQQGVRRVWLLVERNNLPAVSLYQHVGFTLSKALGYDVEMEIFL